MSALILAAFVAGLVALAHFLRRLGEARPVPAVRPLGAGAVPVYCADCEGLSAMTVDATCSRCGSPAISHGGESLPRPWSEEEIAAREQSLVDEAIRQTQRDRLRAAEREGAAWRALLRIAEARRMGGLAPLPGGRALVPCSLTSASVTPKLRGVRRPSGTLSNRGAR